MFPRQYLYLPDELTAGENNAINATVLGLGDDALPALLAAAVDPRIGQVAVSGYFQGFVSQMVARPPSQTSLPLQWNDPQLDAIIRSQEYDTDFGSAIPGSLRRLEVIDLARLIAPRRLLFCAPKDLRAPWAEAATREFKNLGDSVRYAPSEPVNAQSLVEWLTGHSRR